MLYKSFKNSLDVVVENQKEVELITYFNEYYECNEITHQFERPLFLAFLELKGQLTLTDSGLWPIDESILGVDIHDYFDLMEADGGVNLQELDSIYSLDGLKALLTDRHKGYFDLRKRPIDAAIEKWNKLYDKEDSELLFKLLQEYDFDIAIFESNGKYGLKNWDGSILATPIYDDFTMFAHHDLSLGSKIVAYSGDKCGIIQMGDKEQWILEPKYDYIGFPKNLVNVYSERKAGVYDLVKNDWLIPVELDELSDNNGVMFSNGIAFYSKEGKQGVLLSTGEHTGAKYDEIDYSIDEYLKVRIGNKWGYIGEVGELVDDIDEAYFTEMDY